MRRLLMDQHGTKKYFDWYMGLNKKTSRVICSNKIEDQIYVNRFPRESEILNNWSHLGVDTSINKYGFRDKDFFEKADLLINGCSQTWGTALPEKYRFSNIIQESFSGTVHNIGYEGNSVGSVIRSTFAYIKKFGNPKYIYLMLPPFERIEFIPDKNTFTKSDWLASYKEFQKEGVEDIDFSPIQITTVDIHTPIYAKAPFYIEDVMNPQSAFFLNMQMLLMLEQYCDVAGIKFMWSAWNNSYRISDYIFNMQNNLNEHKNYFHIPVWDWELNDEKIDILDTADCHKDLEKEDQIFFNHAMDIGKRKTETPHWGSHRNRHIAEKILHEMKNRSYEGLL